MYAHKANDLQKRREVGIILSKEDGGFEEFYFHNSRT